MYPATSLSEAPRTPAIPGRGAESALREKNIFSKFQAPAFQLVENAFRILVKISCSMNISLKEILTFQRVLCCSRTTE